MTEKEKNGFLEVAESLKKYRRADLVDQNGESILDELYVDLLDGNIILKRCLLDNTTFLVGRKGTGKSTLFLKLESEYRKKPGYFPCYVDVKTVYESSKTVVINQDYLQEYFRGEQLQKYLIARNFIQSVLKKIYEEIDKQSQNFLDKVAGNLFGNSKKAIKEEIQGLIRKVDDNKEFQRIELPALQEIKTIHDVTNRNSKACAKRWDFHFGKKYSDLENTEQAGGELSSERAANSENAKKMEESLTDICLKVFDIQQVIADIKAILGKMKIQHLVILLDDVSEIENDALELFVDTIVAPLNNWSEEFIKFKVAFYPNRIHYGKIDPGKIDVVNLDFYNLYSEFDSNRMEENAIDFTRRVLNNRFNYYTNGIEKYFDEKLEDIYETFFKVSMNVPRIMGYILSYLYVSAIIYGKRIRKVDIENASEKYYDEKIEAFFKASTYCLLPVQENRKIYQLEELKNVLISRSKEIKKQILSGELTGKLYQKSCPYASHFHIAKEAEQYVMSLELNHFITKYDEKSNRDGRAVSIYCFNYGLAKKNNIPWGKPTGKKYRTYFIERPFNYTTLILNQIKEVKVLKCTNSECGRVFSESDRGGLEFTHFKCPDCQAAVVEESVIDAKIEEKLKNITLEKITVEEMDVLLALNAQLGSVYAKDIATDVDMNSQRIAKIFKKLAEDKKLVIRDTTSVPYKYKISAQGRLYFT